jgi:hypothetical protein
MAGIACYLIETAAAIYSKFFARLLYHKLESSGHHFAQSQAKLFDKSVTSE